MDINKLLKLSADLICTVDSQNRFVEVSDAAYPLLGYRPSEMQGRSYKDFVVPDDLSEAEEAVLSIMTKRPVIAIQIRYRHKDGRIIPLFWTVQWDEDDQLMYGIARSGDITAQTEMMRESLEESNLRYQYVTQATSDAIWDWNILEGSLYWGEGFETIFGHDLRGQLGGIHSWTQFIHPDDFNYVMQSLEAIRASKDNNWKQEYRYQKADGVYADVVDRGFVIRNKNGDPVRMVGAMHDISERKKALFEMGRVTADLFKRNRELHEFGYIVSHNLRAPVANIKSLATLIEMEFEIPELLKPYIANLMRSVYRMDEVIIDLSKILSSKNRSDELKAEALDLRDIVSQIRVDMEDKIAHSHAQITMTGGPFQLNSHQAYLYSILFNLIANSIKYQFEYPPIIKIHIQQTAEEFVISYIDNSYGIDLLRHGDDIFKPYKGFHPTIKGKGLGLFLVKSYIEALDGSIIIESSANQGISYRICLPKI